MKDLPDVKPAAGPYPQNSVSPRERPLLFSGEMVKAILDGRKTQTRRVMHPQPIPCGEGALRPLLPSCPYGWLGDRLWVREAFIAESPQCVHYRADGWEYGDRAKWKQSIFMPRWASRITLEVIGVRVERIQDISSRDAFAEGIIQTRPDIPKDPQIDSQRLWDAINKKRGFGWFANPWVWVIEFKKLETPIPCFRARDPADLLPE